MLLHGVLPYVCIGLQERVALAAAPTYAAALRVVLEAAVTSACAGGGWGVPRVRRHPRFPGARSVAAAVAAAVAACSRTAAAVAVTAGLPDAPLSGVVVAAVPSAAPPAFAGRRAGWCHHLGHTRSHFSVGRRRWRQRHQ